MRIRYWKNQMVMHVWLKAHGYSPKPCMINFISERERERERARAQSEKL